MNFDFPSDTLMLRDILRRFVQKEAQPLEMKYFTSGELTLEEREGLRQTIEQMGLWGLMAPEEFGGGLDMVTACMIEEELGKTFIPVDIGDVPALLYACTDGQITHFLEPALSGNRHPILAVREPGSFHPTGWKATATHHDDHYILNGHKILAVPPTPEDFFIVFAHAPQGLTAFLLDGNHPGLSVATNGKVVLTLCDCRAERDTLLGEPGGALEFKDDEGPRAMIRLGARYVGITERLIEMAVDHAKDWMSLGAPLAARPAIQRLLAEMRVEIESTRWLVYYNAWLVDEDQCDSLRNRAAQVRLATGEMLQRSVDRTTMIYTGPGPSSQIEPHRLVRSVVPPEALELALEHARAAIAAEMLDFERV